MSTSTPHGIERILRRLSLVAASALICWPLVSSAGEVRFDGEGHAENPVWSKDGKYVAFEVNRFAGDIEMFFAEVSGDIAKDALKVKLPGGSSGFGSSGQVVVNPTWHPDGVAVFEGSNQGGQFRLYFMSPGGSAAAEMLSSTKAPGDLTFPSISPDGNKLAFISDQTGNGDIRIWDRSSDKLDQLTSTDGSEMFPQFSADGTQIVFTRKHNDTEDVYVFDIAASSETSVASGGGDQTRPAFAADGEVVYFASGAAQDTWDLEAVGVDGSNRRTLAQDVRLPVRARPAMSADREWVAIAHADPTKSNKIVLLRVDGTKTVDIETSFVACGEPALTDQNGRIVLAYTSLPDSEADWRFLTVQDVTDRL